MSFMALDILVHYQLLQHTLGCDAEQIASAQAEVMGMMPFFCVKSYTPCASKVFWFCSWERP